MIILFILLGILIGSLTCYLILRNSLKQKEILDIETQRKNRELTKVYIALNSDYKTLQKDYKNLQENFDIQKSEIHNNLIKEQQIANDSFERSMEKLANDYKTYELECQQSYEDLLADLKSEVLEKTNEIIAQNNQIEMNKHIIDLVIKANKNAEEKREQQEFYKIKLTKENLEEIAALRQVASNLRNPEVLNKLIWKTYFERPTSDLINRIIGVNKITIGIYKITNNLNSKVYIGQSVDISTRLKTHIKAGLGIDSSNNKLYTEMKDVGVENFSFEIIEECERTQLNEREKFWIEYYQSTDFGYNIQKGNKL